MKKRSGESKKPKARRLKPGSAAWKAAREEALKGYEQVCEGVRRAHVDAREAQLSEDHVRMVRGR